MKSILSMIVLSLLCVATFNVATAQGTATVKAKFNNTDRDRIYFDFMEQSDANMEFPYKAGQVLEFMVDIDDITMMRINTFVLVVLQPGDEIEIEVDYVGRNYKDARFKGSSAESVAASEALNAIRADRLSRRYKTNMPAAMAIQTSPEVFFKTTKDEWEKEMILLEQYKNRLSEKVYNFVRSDLDAIFIPNLISYPGNQDQEGYWTALVDYKLRDDNASMANFSYLGMLNTYMRYTLFKEANRNGETFNVFSTLKEEYDAIATFFDGKLRDGALMVFIYSSLASGKDFDTLEALFEDYVKKYNLNPRYKRLLMDVMK